MECPFCNINYFVIENTYAYAVCDKYPVTRGHLLIIPRQHINNYFDISINYFLPHWKSMACNDGYVYGCVASRILYLQ